MEKDTYYEVQAKQFVDKLTRQNDAVRILKLIKENVPEFRVSSEATFAAHYSLAQLAVGASFWKQFCQEQDIKAEKIQKAFLKASLDRFSSPEHVPLATLFSEYLHAPDKHDQELVMIATAELLFKKLEQEGISKGEKGEIQISPAFRLMVETFEGFRSYFSEEFMGFVHRYTESKN